MVSVAFYLIGLAALLVALFIVLPVSDPAKAQIMSITGLLITLVVSITSGTVISNSMAGLMIVLADKYQVGDTIRVGDHVGTVEEISLLETKLRTRRGHTMSIPNSYFMARPTVVDQYGVARTGVSVTVPRCAASAEAGRLLVDAAEGYEPGEPSFEPSSLHVELAEVGEDGTTWRVHGTAYERPAQCRADLKRRVIAALADAGIELLALRDLERELIEA